MAGNSLDSRAPASPAARWRCSAPSTSEHRRLTLTELAERAGLPMPTAHRLVGELVDWGALSRDAAGRVRRRPPALGRRPARPGADRAAAAGLAVPARPLRRHARHRAPGGARRDRGALPRPALRHASVPVVSTIGSRLPMHATGVGKVLLAHAPAGGAGGGAGRPDAGSRRTRSPSRARCAGSWPASLRDGYAHDGRGDEPGRLLGGRADPGRGQGWSPRSASWCPSLRQGPGAGSSRRCRSPRRASAGPWRLARTVTDFH